jgi:hypothetical protein
VAVAAVVIAVWAGRAAAMYTPNPAARWAPQHFFLAGDFQFNDKDLNHGGEIKDMTGFFARPSYSVARNVAIYGLLGFQTAQDVDTGFAGGFGVQGAYVLPRARAWAIGGSFQFLHWASNFSSRCVDRDAFGFCTAAVGGDNLDWNEFQLTPAVSYRIPTAPGITPYAGMLLDFVDARDSIHESDPVGLLLGTNIDVGWHLRLDAQLRVASETGFLLSVGYMF